MNKKPAYFAGIVVGVMVFTLSVTHGGALGTAQAIAQETDRAEQAAHGELISLIARMQAIVERMSRNIEELDDILSKIRDEIKDEMRPERPKPPERPKRPERPKHPEWPKPSVVPGMVKISDSLVFQVDTARGEVRVMNTPRRAKEEVFVVRNQPTVTVVRREKGGTIIPFGEIKNGDRIAIIGRVEWRAVGPKIHAINAHTIIILERPSEES